jgi:hypothetical protein
VLSCRDPLGYYLDEMNKVLSWGSHREGRGERTLLGLLYRTQYGVGADIKEEDLLQDAEVGDGSRAFCRCDHVMGSDLI